MKKFAYILILVAVALTSCNDYETYGDKKEKERNAISKFIADSAFVVISEDQFVKNGYKTDLDHHEFVKLDKSGVYMQIVRGGCGDILADGESTNIVCRFREKDIINDTLQAHNDVTVYAGIPDIMQIARKGGTYTASFTSGVMYSVYGASVPAGWLVPLPYIKIGRPQSMEEECSKVRLIVPHSQGHSTATSYVKPYYYVITYEREAR